MAPAPERTCIGCRRKRGQAELVRLTNDAGRVVPARPGAPGRSAYLCPGQTCLEAAERRRAFARAFRGPVVLDPAVRRAVALHTSDERR
ncbi:MAG: YlxR family protein [Actinobacteria bacterium]|nr:YlxR family protein [Actinomycetota bacterium]